MTNLPVPTAPTLPSAESAGLPILVSKAAMEVLSDPLTAEACQKVVDRAIGLSLATDVVEPCTVLFQNGPLCVHIDPARAVVLILTKRPGLMGITDALTEELIPLCAPVSFA